jgi:hypothetical protein
VSKINQEGYELPLASMATELCYFGYLNQCLTFYVPTWVAIMVCFVFFGQKMVCIVFFGCLILVMLTCYSNIIKSELLIDMKEAWGGKHHWKKSKQQSNFEPIQSGVTFQDYADLKP